MTSQFSITPSLVIRSKPQGLGPDASELEDRIPYAINLYALWSMTKNIEIFADLRNITDHRYASSSVAGWAAPQETFSGIVGVKLGF